MLVLTATVLLRLTPGLVPHAVPSTTFVPIQAGRGAGPVIESDSAWEQTTPDESSEIQRLIGQFESISKPFVGASEGLWGSQFAPLGERAEHVGAFKFDETNHGNDAAFTKVVVFGPKAIPFLVKALDDRTPTGLTLGKGSRMGMVWFAEEMAINPANPLDDHQMGKRAARARTTEEVERQMAHKHAPYDVTVGDIAFVALGQIVNRPYSVARYQPSGNMVLCSPHRYPSITDSIQGAWKTDSATTRLFASLLLDLGTASGNELERPILDWVHLGAATRLAFYYPDSSAHALVTHLAGLRARSVRPSGINRLMADEDIADFTRAITCSRVPFVLDSLLELLEETDSAAVILALCDVHFDVPARSRLPDKIDAIIRRAPPAGPGPYTSECYLLQYMLQLDEKRGVELCKVYRNHSTSTASHSVLKALEAHGDLSPEAVELLIEMLEDSREVHETHPVGKRHVPIRVCDAAAQLLAKSLEGVRFDFASERSTLDVQIAAMKSVLASRKRPK